MIEMRWLHSTGNEYHTPEPVLQYRVMQDKQAYSNPFSDAPFMKKMEWSEWMNVPSVQGPRREDV